MDSMRELFRVIKLLDQEASDASFFMNFWLEKKKHFCQEYAVCFTKVDNPQFRIISFSKGNFSK